jgi:hypothetical protein
MARAIGRLMLIKIWRSKDMRVDPGKKEALKNLRNEVKIRNRAVIRRNRLVK